METVVEGAGPEPSWSTVALFVMIKGGLASIVTWKLTVAVSPALTTPDAPLGLLTSLADVKGMAPPASATEAPLSRHVPGT